MTVYRIRLDEQAWHGLLAGKTVRAQADGVWFEVKIIHCPPDPPQAREFLPRKK